MANEIMQAYKEKCEPGLFKDNEQLKMKTQGGGTDGTGQSGEKTAEQPSGPNWLFARDSTYPSKLHGYEV